MKKMKPKTKRILLIIALVLLAVVCACGVYLGTYYHATDEALATAENGAMTAAGDDTLYFIPPDDDGVYESAVVFYPGGKVQQEAYAPLCSALAERGVLCALVKMPFNLAVFDMNAADDVISYMAEEFGCGDIYLAGHSLGGAMGSYYAAANPQKLSGLILLGAYSGKDLTGTDLRVLSIYGSQDGVLSRDKYAGSMAYMPANFTETVLEGGCHAYFGSYGSQKGDGTPTISNEEQITQTADIIAAWIMRTEA